MVEQVLGLFVEKMKQMHEHSLVSAQSTMDHSIATSQASKMRADDAAKVVSDMIDRARRGPVISAFPGTQSSVPQDSHTMQHHHIVAVPGIPNYTTQGSHDIHNHRIVAIPGIHNSLSTGEGANVRAVVHGGLSLGEGATFQSTAEKQKEDAIKVAQQILWQKSDHLEKLQTNAHHGNSDARLKAEQDVERAEAFLKQHFGIHH
ncbi:hypothetical protein TWF506_005318 [Arthrobotrys conoides]|uniref:Uncharacterized protein n=1 Tax=Arthrobotrys conoides TaxID=74498 RepID=A0AAN8RPU3_9PEZI